MKIKNAIKILKCSEWAASVEGLYACSINPVPSILLMIFAIVKYWFMLDMLSAALSGPMNGNQLNLQLI